jgi:predicted permease
VKHVRRFCHRLLGSLTGARKDDDLAQELNAHVQLMTDDLVGRGVDPANARREALLAFGGVEQAKERYRDQRGLPSLDAIRRDLRLVVRSLARTPALAFIVVLTLGLAVGANAAIFSLIDRVALRPLPVERPEDLVRVDAPPLPYWGSTFNAGPSVDYPLIKSLREGLSDVFSAAAVSRPWRFTLALEPRAVDIMGQFVNQDFFRVYNLRSTIGRTIAATEDSQRDAPMVVVLNHGFWMRQFGGDRSILNCTIRLNKIAVTVVGVLAAPGYSGSDPARVPQVFLPLGAADQLAPFRPSGGLIPWDSPALRIYRLVARLRPGVDRIRAEQALQARYRVLLDDMIARGARLTPEDQKFFASHQPALVPAGTVGSMESATRQTFDLPLRLLLGMTVLVLIVAAGNVANLLLARGAARQHEVAVSYALGAQRWHLLRPLLLESLLLGLASAAVGLLLSAWAGNLVPTLLGLNSDLAGISTEPDRRVVAFTLLVSLGAALLIWLASAIAVTRRSRASLAPTRPLAEGGRPALILRRGLVIVQVAFSLALLCTSALFARSLAHVISVDPGFDARALLAFSVNPGSAGYEGQRRQAFVDRVASEIRAVPGVTHAATTSMLPLAAALSGSFLEGPRQAAGRAPAILVNVVHVGPDFFGTTGLPVTKGRRFDERDAPGAPRVAMVNESLARLLADGASVMDQRVGFKDMPRDTTVVGIVKDVRTRSLKTSTEPTLFLPAAQAAGGSDVHILARIASPGVLNAATVQAIVKRLDPAVAVTDVRSVEQLARDRLLRERMLAGFSFLFAGLSAVLAALGLVGVASFSVARRTREIAIRLALGASRARIGRLVFGEVGALALVGGAVGLALFLASNKVFRSLLFEISEDDPLAMAAAVFALTVAACLAGVWPARRAARLDPAVTLRAE